MNILLISSSPHGEKSRTFKLAGEVIKGLGSNAEVDTVHLYNHKIEFCLGCDACHLEVFQCPLKDDAMNILAKMMDADAVILVSPNYINQVTASM